MPNFTSLILLSICLALSNAWPIQVNTQQGTVRGFQKNGGALNVFLGIPYAEPPLAALRWKPPQTKLPWTDVLETTSYKPGCPQTKAFSPPIDAFGEDCLYLNIWASNTPSGDKPVLLWIHGGGFQNGANSEARLDGTNMALASDTVVVNINYRLAAIGFLAIPGLEQEDPTFPTAGNYGLVDQRFALEWVQKNIALFGGNPNDVTIMGESAGGASVNYHLVMPKSFPFFHKAIAESGYGLPMIDLNDAMVSGSQIATSLGCTGSNQQVISCMRSKSWQEIIDKSPAVNPIVDGFTMPQLPYKSILEGKINYVPFISGGVLNEGSVFTYGEFPHPANQQDLNNFVMKNFKDDYQAILNQYPCSVYSSSGDCWYAGSEIFGDYFFNCQNNIYAKAINQKVPNTYMFVFSHRPSYGLSIIFGAYHSAEIEFVFSTVDIHPHDPAEITLSNWMTTYWTNFARSGDPNLGQKKAGMIFWPKFNEASNYSRINLDLDLSLLHNYRAEQCNLWEKFYPH